MSNGKIDFLVTLKDGFSFTLGKVKAGFGGLLRGVGGFARGAGRMLTSLPTLLAGGAMAGAFSKAFTSFGKQEQSTQGLRSALSQMGDASDSTLKRLEKFSAELQNVTKFGDEATQEVMALGLNLGVPAARIEEVTKAAIGLSKKTGMDLRSAMLIMGRSAAGGAVALSRYGIVIDSTLTPQKKFNELIRQGNTYFGQAAEEAANASGRFVQFKNAVGDLWERAGQAITVVFNLKGGFEKLRDAVNGISLERIVSVFGRVAQVANAVGGTFAWLRGRVQAALNSEMVQGFISRVVTGVKAVIGIFKGLGDGTIGIGKLLGELGVMIGTQLKLAFMTAVNWLAQGLQATVAALTAGIGGSIQVLTNPSFWAGLAQIIIGSLGAVGAFLIKIFTEPLVMLQAGIDTIIKGMFNALAKAGGNRDENGTGRLGRKLGIAVQENDYDKNLADARKNSWLLNTASQGANDSKDILGSGMKKVGDAMASSGVGEVMASTFTDALKGKELFDTSAARSDLSSAASALARYGDGIKLPDLPKFSETGAAATAPVIAAAIKKTDIGIEAKKSKGDIDVAARMDWMRATSRGKTPEDETAENTKEIATILKEMKKDKVGIL